MEIFRSYPPSGGGGGITGGGTTPQLAYFTGGTVISSTPLAEVGTNDIIFNGGIAAQTRVVTTSTTALVDDYYIGVDTRVAGVVVTLPLLASVPEGKIYVVMDESGQNGVFSINITPQIGEFINYQVTIAMIFAFQNATIIKSNGQWRGLF